MKASAIIFLMIAILSASSAGAVGFLHFRGGGAILGLTANQTITNSCAGSLCTPAAASCAVFTNGLLTGFSTGAC